MLSRLPIAVTCLLIALLAGCTEDEFRASGSESYEPYRGEVELLNQLPAAGTYELIGVVMVRGVNLTADERMFKQLKELAAERGADAVVPQGKIRVRPTVEGGEERRLAGYAIRRFQ